MSAQATSVGALVSALLLSDHRVLQLSWETPFVQALGWKKLREPTYLAYQLWAARFPDHVFDSAWKFLVARERNEGSVLRTALEALIDDFLELRHGKVCIRRDLFGAWQQGLTSRLSVLPVQAAADVRFGIHQYKPSSSSRLQSIASGGEDCPWRSKIVPLLRPDEASVADYVKREGLHETHLHLNGSTHAEICWLRAIRVPDTETREFVAAWTRGRHRSRICELIGQVNPDLTPQVLFQHLRTASRLRAWLVGAAEDQILPDARLPFSCQSLFSMGSDEWSIGLTAPMPPWRREPQIQDEVAWMAKLVASLMQRPSVQLTRMFHAYLLLSNEYYRLLVQSEAQYGFDQFQKFTLTDLREPSERDYQTRFQAMHGSQLTNSTVGYLEGRFAPKTQPLKACRIFHAILGGYLNYLSEATASVGATDGHPRSLSALLLKLEKYFERPVIKHRSILRLTLVAHFIKQPWPPMHGSPGPFRHYQLDLELRRTTGVLLSVLARWPRLQTWVRGIDAAANELHAPPEVFAPVFRVCLRSGLTRRTYHAGEDFRHLLSGIATMWEALTLLDLRDGDRIGHGTAMGIRPDLWLDRMPGTLTLSRGEWMLSVLAAWQLLREVPEMQACAHRLQHEFEDVSYQIFHRSLPARDVERAMALRGLSRRDLLRRQSGDADWPHESLSEPWRAETALVQSACLSQPHEMDLLWEWLSAPEVQSRADEQIVKEANFLDASTYIRLQQVLMQHVAVRGVLIETLPSSNVRISQYHHVDEHHSLRWMRVPGHAEDGDPEIMVCLGSDDPGIFAGSLENEFYLLYSAMRRSGLCDADALKRLSLLNERGRIFRFHDPVLS